MFYGPNPASSYGSFLTDKYFTMLIIVMIENRNEDEKKVPVVVNLTPVIRKSPTKSVHSIFL